MEKTSKINKRTHMFIPDSGVLWPFDKKLIFWIVTCVSACDYTVVVYYKFNKFILTTSLFGTLKYLCKVFGDQLTDCLAL